MNIRLPLWVLRRIVRRNPWLLSTTGTVSRSLVLDVFLWEMTIDTSWELLPDVRKRLIMERDQRFRSMEDDLPPTA